MTEEQLKFLCKWAVQNSQRPFTEADKELLKQAIDKANTVEDLLAVVLAAAAVN